MKTKVWQVLHKQKSKSDVIDVLLENRGLMTKKEKEEFFRPISPDRLTLKELGIGKLEISKAKKRISLAKKNKEKVIIYGDYDADGVTATAILWEALYKFGLDVMPYIPDRFSEGYGINTKSIEELKLQNPNIKLIITVDNGIVAHEAIKAAKKMGIDVIVTDHHVASKTKPQALAIIHTTEIGGSAVAWITAREITKSTSGLELVAIGTIADQLPLTHVNRSFAKFGITELNRTKRLGLIEIMKQAGLDLGNLGTYEINYVIAPRINAMGRLSHALDALRLLCAKNKEKAKDLARLMAKTNVERQKIVDEVLITVKKNAKDFNEAIIFLAHESYHEGVIGLAAGRLVEEFYKPAIVISKGKEFSKGSARSISGFNIIEAIRTNEKMLVGHGGHPMAAGFTIETAKLEQFRKKLNATAKKKITQDMMTRKIKIDCALKFEVINWEFLKKLKEFEPSGMGNPTPTFLGKSIEVVDMKILGREKNHVKLKLMQGEKFFDGIAFGMANIYPVKKGDILDMVYGVDENEWNGVKSLQLKIRDMKIND